MGCREFCRKNPQWVFETCPHGCRRHYDEVEVESDGEEGDAITPLPITGPILI